MTDTSSSGTGSRTRRLQASGLYRGLLRIYNALYMDAVLGWRQVAGRPRFRHVNKFLFDLSVHGLGLCNYQNDRVSGERVFVTKTLPTILSQLHRAPVLVDVGAHRGEYAALFLSTFPNGRVLCVEPSLMRSREIEERFGGRVDVVNAAMSSTEGTAVMYDKGGEENSQHASLYKEVITDLWGMQAVSYEVSVVTLDSLAKSTRLPRVDLLKIDTEGSEYDILLGAQELISTNRVGVVQIEFNEMNLVSRRFVRDFRAILPHHAPFRLLPHGLLEVPHSALDSELFAFQNIVFLPSKDDFGSDAMF